MSNGSMELNNDRIDPLSDKLKLSKYASSLLGDAKCRYNVKRLYNFGQAILPDPYLLEKGWTTEPRNWPDLTFGDIYCYLIESPGIYTKDSLKAYKSLDAYRFVVSGHVQAIEYNDIGDDVPYCAMRVKVTPSQRVTEKPHQAWVYIEKKSSTIYCAHCTCMAGLGEVCSHAAALLFKVEIGVKLGLNDISATSGACQWNNSFRKQIEPMTIEDLQPLIKGKRVKPVPSTTPSSKDPLPDVDILKSLKEACPDAVFFTTIDPLDPEETETASETGESAQILRPLRDLYSHQYVNLSENELVKETMAAWSQYKCTYDQARDLEAATKGQSVSPLWYEHRKGRITGTKAHDVLVARSETNARLVRQVTGHLCYNLGKQKAVKWGTDNEQKAKGVYLQSAQKHHRHLMVINSGLLVDHRRPYIGVSSDGIVTCTCCPRRLLEIKCPYKHKDSSITQAAQSDKDFCLTKELTLKLKHRYYTQVQIQMFVHRLDSCDFFVYTNVDCVTVNIKKDSHFCDLLVSKIENFFVRQVLPELCTRKLENIPEPTLEPENNADSTTQEVWCLCREPEYGRMIECKNTDCPARWFHYECVNVRRCPRGKWYCPQCSE